MEIVIFTKESKLADLISANRNLILVLPRFGIELGFGDKSVEDVCQMYGVDVQMFLMICKVYTFNDYLPTTEQIREAKFEDLLKYLEASHKYYKESRIPHIARHLDHLAAAMPEKDGKLLRRFYKEYEAEVDNHFMYEESTVFPYIQELTTGSRSSSFTIETFEENHSNIEDKLSDLKNIIIKYLPAGILPEERISILFDLFRLAEDLDKHTLIENKILAPYVELLEAGMQ